MKSSSNGLVWLLAGPAGKALALCVIGTIGLTMVGTPFAQAQETEAVEWPTPAPEDVSTVDGIIKAYYEVVSGAEGSPRNWDRDKSLHYPGAQVVITGGGPDSLAINRVSISDWHAQSGTVQQRGFFEYEIARKVRQHGSTVHVWSTYEWTSEEGGAPQGQGINSIEMVWDGSRYWITSWSFDGRDTPVPLEYLPGND